MLMDTTYVFLWLEAPLQSWGFDSKFGRRDTQRFPTKSGVLGLVLCAMGASGKQAQLLARFADLRQTVISFRKAKKTTVAGTGEKKVCLLPKEPLLHDFHMIGSGYDEKDPWQSLLIPKTADGKSAVGGGTKITHRFYLQDAVFAVLFEVPMDMADSLAKSLQYPVYDIYLGRKCCVPTDFIYQGLFPTEKEAIMAARQKAASKSTGGVTLVEEFSVYDAVRSDINEEEGDIFTLNDVPVQFGSVKKYRDRRVVVIAADS